MGKYQVEAQQLLEFVGGKDNISMVTHCVTRIYSSLLITIFILSCG